jgi:hypothetical protein
MILRGAYIYANWAWADIVDLIQGPQSTYSPEAN